MIVWTDSYLNQLLIEGEEEIVNRVDCIFHRFTLDITQGDSTYVLPSFVRRITRITWKGVKVEPISFSELRELSPTTLVPGFEATEGTPKYYSPHGGSYNEIRFYPTPGESIAADDEDIDGEEIPNQVIVSCYRTPDITDSLLRVPTYIGRRTTKAYALMKAFLKEGKGQDIEASNYYRAKFEYLIAQFKLVNSNIFLSKRYQLTGSIESPRLARPVLPDNYERVI